MTSRPPASPRFLIVACGWLALTLSAAGCKQGEGDRCEQDSDCQSGLVCRDIIMGSGACRSPNATPTSGTGGTTVATGTGGSDGAVDAEADATSDTATSDALVDAPVD